MELVLERHLECILLLEVQSGQASLAFVFGMGSVAFTYKISSMKKERSAMTLVLSGVIVSSVFNALIALIKLAADTDSVLPAITYWLMGSFTGANYKKCAVAGLAVALVG